MVILTYEISLSREEQVGEGQGEDYNKWIISYDTI